MATTNPGQPQYCYGGTSNPVQQGGGVQPDNNNRARYHLKRLKTIGNVQVAAGSVLVCLGVIAIVLKAQWSYFATPLWAGVLFFIMAGTFGVKGARTGKRSWIGAHIALSVVSSLLGFAICQMYVWAAVLENNEYHHSISTCQPAGNDYIILNCYSSEATRMAFDILISVTGIFLFVLCIVAASFGCCAGCACCQMCCGSGCCGGGESGNCCCPPDAPTTTLYVTQGSGMQAGVGQVPNQPGYYVVQPNSVAMPPSSVPPYTQAPGGRRTPPPVYPGYAPSPAPPQPAGGMQTSYQAAGPVTEKKG